MKREEMSMTLPEHLVERILAMVPYPCIFKARVLSKLWLARLSPVSSQGEDEDKKHRAISFQKLVQEYSSKWKIYGPSVFGRTDFFGYEKEFERWRSIPNLSFLRNNVLSKSMSSYLDIWDVEGALVLFRRGPKDLCVANVLTRSWKRLPPAPNTIGERDTGYPGRKLVSHMDTYKVIELYSDVGYSFAKIYDSRSGAWICKRLDISGDLKVLKDSGKSLNGVLYWVVCDHFMGYELGWGLLAWNIEEETVSAFQVMPLKIPFLDMIKLVVCNGSLLLLVYKDLEYPPSVMMLSIDLGSRKCLEVTQGPPYPRTWQYFQIRGISDGDCIFHKEFNCDYFHAYDMAKDAWGCFSIPDNVDDQFFDKYEDGIFSFQPGLNPFVAV